MARSSARKRQTTLNFSPMPSSSPGAAALSPHVRNRAAAVEYVGSSVKRRKIAQEEVTKDVAQALPTPRKSSQAQGNSSAQKDELYDITSSDDDIITFRPSQRPKVNPKQTRMGFGQPVLANGGRARTKQRTRGSGLFSSDPVNGAATNSGSESSKWGSEEELAPPAPPPSSPPASERRSARARGKAPMVEIDGDVTARRSNRSGKGKKSVVELFSEEEEEDELPSPSKLKNNKGMNGDEDIGEAESSAGEMPVSSAVKPRQGRRQSKKEAWIVDDDGGVVEAPAKSSKRSVRKGVVRSQKAREESWINDDEDDEQEETERSPTSSKRKRKRQKVDKPENTDEEDLPSSKRLHKRKGNQQETEDLEEDL
ncbi:hypothetical protein LTS18_003192, partial [Coniosporium uncinatum]